MLSFIQNIFIYFIELLSFYFLSINFKQNRFKLTISLSISLPLFATIFTIMDIFLSNPVITFFIQCICYILFFKINLHIGIQEGVYTYLITFIINITIQFATSIPIQLLHISLTNVTMQLMGISITFICCMLFYFLVPLHNLYLQALHTSIFTQLVLINTGILYVAIILFYRFHSISTLETTLFIVFLISTAIGVNGEIINANLKIIKKEKKLEIYTQYLPIVEELIDQVRIKQHKHDNEIQALCALPLTCSTYEELSDALEQYSRTAFQNNVPIELLKLNYKLLAGFLYQKTTEAAKKGITLSISIKNFALQTIVPEYELLEMTGILLDNAIEATAESEIIKVSIDSYQSKFCISISNPGPVIDTKLQKLMFKKGYTTKSIHPEQHGLGLYILKRKVSSYNGMIQLDNSKQAGKHILTFQLII
ncbi:MAG: GHKL domain-containing protein [Lachnospiraceae bacterium]|nr:GHKL domain-containing protein [Lachnospiraceae bacterium]